jgi:LysM repeat protein
MRRLVVVPVALMMLAGVASGCGAEPTSSAETLPPIRTTTTTTTTTVPPDLRRKFYEVKQNDYLSEIARRFQVTREAIVELNGLDNGGETLQIGQILEIPSDVYLVPSLPPEPESSSSTSEP